MITTRGGLGTHVHDRTEEVRVPERLVRDLSTLPIVQPVKVRYRGAKRTLDVIVAAGLLIIGFVPMLIIGLIVKLSSRGSVFYTCERIGLGGKPFRFLKFRTMYTDAEARLEALKHRNEKDGPIFKLEDDPRTTGVGRILRRYSLDELPQIIHVLTGKMTLVGPRPPLRREVLLYDIEHTERLTVTPGLTCYWQIGGRSDLSFERWMELDRKYIREMSFWTDLKILVKTPAAVISGRGAY